jgi:hypothetical protein
MEVKSVASKAYLNFLGSVTIIHGNAGLNMRWYYVELCKLVLNTVRNHGGPCSRKGKALVRIQVSSSSKLTAFCLITQGMCS